MGHIFYVMGKSASGKDTIYKKLLGEKALGLKPFVIYTTRPIREGELDGREYYFTDEDGLNRIKVEGRLIEERAYDTVHGIWRYFTADHEGVNLQEESYLLIGTPAAFVQVRDYYGAEKVIPIYVEVEDGERLFRALQRERQQKEPRYAELCRRFLADAKDFDEELLKEAGIERRFVNKELADCLSEISDYIRSCGKTNRV